MEYTITIRVNNDVDTRKLNKKYADIAGGIMDSWDKLIDILNAGEDNNSHYKIDYVKIWD